MQRIVDSALVCLYRAWAEGSAGTTLAEAARLTIIDPALGRRLAREFESRGLATVGESPELWRILPAGIACVERLLKESDPDVVRSRASRSRILGALVDPSGSAEVCLSTRALADRTGLTDVALERSCGLLEAWHLIERGDAGLWSITRTGKAITQAG